MVDPDAALEEAHDLLEEWAQLAYEYPLALCRLWVAESSPWDQRRAAMAWRGHQLASCMGGNRSGKTFLGKMLTVASAMGGDHPMVQAWLQDNHLPADLIKLGPAEVCAVAQSAADSVRYHRDDLDQLLPATGKRWYNRNAVAEAWVEIEVPGYHQRARIWCKSADQGARSFKGKEYRWCWVDEELVDEKAKLVFEELLRSVSSTGGTVFHSFTPQAGTATWYWEQIVLGGEYDPVVIQFDTYDNTMVEDPEGLKRWIESLDEHQKKMRRFGIAVDRQGLVYPEWQRGDLTRSGMGHLVEPFEVPADWLRFRASDFGIHDPTAVVWGAIDPDDDGMLYIYRVHKQAGISYAEHAAIVHELQGDLCHENGTVREYGEVIECAWGDPGGVGAEALDKWAELDLPTRNATRSQDVGLDEVRDRLRLRGDNRPRMKVFADCMPLVEEIEQYRWNPKLRVQKPLKKNDHLMDALRYLCIGIREDGW